MRYGRRRVALLRLAGKRVPRVAGIELIDALVRACARLTTRVLSAGREGRHGAARRRRTASDVIRALRVAAPATAISARLRTTRSRRGIADSGANVAVRRTRLAAARDTGSPSISRRRGAWVGIGVGGSFDVLAGNVERAPGAVAALEPRVALPARARAVALAAPAGAAEIRVARARASGSVSTVSGG